MCNILLNDGTLASFPSICPKLCNNEVQCVLFWFFHAVFNMLRKMIQNGFKNSVSGPRSTYLPKQQMDNNQMVFLALFSSWSPQRESSVSRFSAGRRKHLTFQEPVSAIHQVVPPTLTECWFYVTFLLFVIYNKFHFWVFSMALLGYCKLKVLRRGCMFGVSFVFIWLLIGMDVQ